MEKAHLGASVDGWSLVIVLPLLALALALALACNAGSSEFLFGYDNVNVTNFARRILAHLEQKRPNCDYNFQIRRSDTTHPQIARVRRCHYHWIHLRLKDGRTFSHRLRATAIC